MGTGHRKTNTIKHKIKTYENKKDQNMSKKKKKGYIYSMSAANKGGYTTNKLTTVAYASKQGQQHVSCKTTSSQ